MPTTRVLSIIIVLARLNTVQLRKGQCMTGLVRDEDKCYAVVVLLRIYIR